MPNTREFDEFRIAALGGGIHRRVKEFLIPPGRWSRAYFFRPEKGAAIKQRGYTQFIPSILSPEYQDVLSLGAAFHIQNSGVGAFLSMQSKADPREVVRDGTEWEFKLEIDGEVSWNGDLVGFLPTSDPAVWVSTMLSNYVGTFFSATDIYDPSTSERKVRPEFRVKAGNIISASGDRESCPCVAIHSFTPDSLNEALYLATPKDIYLYNTSTEDAEHSDRLTPKIATGTIDAVAAIFVAGTPASGMDWSGVDDVRADHLFRLTSDGVDALTRISGTGLAAENLQLKENYRGSTIGPGAGAAYEIVRTYNADPIVLKDSRQQGWDHVSWINGSPERLAIWANGGDPVQKHRPGLPEMLPLGGLSGLVDTARVLKVFNDQLHLGYTVESGAEQPRRVRWSEPLDCETYGALKYRDLETEGFIVGVNELRGQTVWFTNRDIHNERVVGDPFDFAFKRQVKDVGCLAPGSIQNLRDEGLIFLGNDDIYLYDLVRPVPIGQDVFDELDLNDEVIGLVDSFVDQEEGLYLLSVPTASGGDKWNYRTLAYDLDERLWSEPTDGFNAFGRYFRQGALFIDDMTEPIDSYTFAIDARLGSGAPITLAGGRSGVVNQLFDSANADNHDVSAFIETGATDCKTRKFKKLGWVVLEYSGSGEVQLEVGLSSDGRNFTWTPPKRKAAPQGVSPSNEVLFGVNRTAKWFKFRITGDSRNQDLELDSLSLHFRERYAR